PVGSVGMRPAEFIEALASALARARSDHIDEPARRVVGLSVSEIADKPLLTLAECQALTGLSRGILRGAIGEGRLKARIIGRAWRVKRPDLDLYVKKL